MKKVLPLLLLVSGAAFADDAAVLKCRALADTASRLACYDAMPLGAASTNAGDQANFGNATVAKVQEAQPKSMDSTVAGEFAGWGPGTRITLANGQVWKVIDDSSAVLPRRSDTKVHIERNVFGTMFLRAEGSNSSAKVRRVE